MVGFASGRDLPLQVLDSPAFFFTAVATPNRRREAGQGPLHPKLVYSTLDVRMTVIQQPRELLDIERIGLTSRKRLSPGA